MGSTSLFLILSAVLLADTRQIVDTTVGASPRACTAFLRRTPQLSPQWKSCCKIGATVQRGTRLYGKPIEVVYLPERALLQRREVAR